MCAVLACVYGDHNHGLEATPRLVYMHFWANDDAGKLAEGPRAALDQTNSQK